LAERITCRRVVIYVRSESDGVVHGLQQTVNAEASMRSIILLLVLDIALPARIAWPITRDGHRTPRSVTSRAVSGELDRYDPAGHTVTLRVDGRTERFQLTSSTVVQEGANIISADRLNQFRRHFTKVTLAGAGPAVARLMISPEEVVTGDIAAYDPARRELRVDTAHGSKAFSIGIDAWCHRGAETIDPAMLADYVGNNVKVTVSQQNGVVLSVWVSKKSG
jgi:hypothetical protein